MVLNTILFVFEKSYVEKVSVEFMYVNNSLNQKFNGPHFITQVLEFMYLCLEKDRGVFSMELMARIVTKMADFLKDLLIRST